jgi:hypothetical protein
MSDFYKNLRDKTALKLLSSKGQKMTLRSTVEGAYDLDTSTKSISQVDYTVIGIITQIDESIAQGLQTDSTTRMAIISASGLSIVPSQKDRMIVKGVEYKILRVIPIDPGGIQVCYKILLASGLQTIVHRESPA